MRTQAWWAQKGRSEWGEADLMTAGLSAESDLPIIGEGPVLDGSMGYLDGQWLQQVHHPVFIGENIFLLKIKLVYHSVKQLARMHMQGCSLYVC